MKLNIKPLLIITTLGVTSCNVTKYIPEGETLYTGTEINIVDSFLSKNDKKELAQTIQSSIRPQANKSFLGLRYKLFFYNLAGTPKEDEKGIKKWIREKLGEEPVLGSEIKIPFNNSLIENQLQNLGYFRAESEGYKEEKDRKTNVYFNVATGKQFTINEVKFPAQLEDNSKIAENIQRFSDSSLLKKDNPYNFEQIKAERSRIDGALKEIGYYYFNPDYLMMVVDTGIGEEKVNIDVNIKWDEIPLNAYEQYRIKDVFIVTTNNNNRNTNFTINNRGDTGVIQTNDSLRLTTIRQNNYFVQNRIDTTNIRVINDGIKLIDRRNNYRDVLFYQSMQLKPGEIYNRRDHNLSLNRLITMGTFKFVKSDIEPHRVNTWALRNLANTDTLDKTKNDSLAQFKSNVQEDAYLDLFYLLTAHPRKQISAELNGFTQNDSRYGSRISATWRNKNTLKGGEMLSIKGSGGFEIQYGGNKKRPNAFNAGIESSLNIPRFIIPLINPKPNGTFVPRTLLDLSYNYSRRGNLYTINSATTQFGYNWKEDIKRDHKLYPVSITYVRTDTLDYNSQFDINLSNLIYNGFIIGSTYEYSYNSRADDNSKRNNYYINVIADIAGNTLGNILGSKTGETPKQIFKSDFAQYGKIQLDGRYYNRIDKNTEWANRMIIGIGLPYGNSTTMPVVKQFYSGGSNSLRGFASRLVGPGTFNGLGSNFIETQGDLKFEFSTEIRRKLYSFIHGAAFIDAGNIWLMRENDKFPGGHFTNHFHKELAVDFGLGLRFDFSILVLRLDFAGPIRKPWLPNGERWTWSGIDFGNKEWRKENLFFNVAIGYPF